MKKLLVLSKIYCPVIIVTIIKTNIFRCNLFISTKSKVDKTRLAIKSTTFTYPIDFCINFSLSKLFKYK